MTDTLSDTRNIRMWAWEKKYPGCTQEITEIFGGIPSMQQISKWKKGWVDSLNNEFYIGVFSGFAYNRTHAQRLGVKKTHKNIKKIALDCGIHPYFWDTCLRTEFDEVKAKELHMAMGSIKKSVHVKQPHIYKTKTMVSFFYREHLVMFKLAWQ
jgi:hypothetical protein